MEMEKQLIKRFSKALGLSRQVVGIKFIFLKEEYEDLDVPEPKAGGCFCALTARAMEGKIMKGKADTFGCQGGPEMLGMKKVSNYVWSGKQFSTLRLYEDAAIARQVQQDLCFVDQRIYGVMTGPLEEMEDADVVMLLCNGWQMMRLIQGYTWNHGMAKNIGMIGNQGICADLVARPYMKNDLNVSMLCLGARTNTSAEDGEIGAGMPVHLFRDVAEGVLKTVNPAMSDKEKQALSERLETPDELGFEIEFGKVYMSYAKEKKYPEELYKQSGND